MRFMVLVKADKNSEAGVLPSPELIAEMGKFNEALVQAGVMLAAEGLHPTSKGARVKFADGKTSVSDGPFADDPETLLAGFWLWQCASKQEAIDWIKRAPFRDTEIEIRQVFEAADFGDQMTPEQRAAEERLRAQAAAKN
ncbi:MAG: YciI family protein [Thiohalocapsa sp.]